MEGEASSSQPQPQHVHQHEPKTLVEGDDKPRPVTAIQDPPSSKQAEESGGQPSTRSNHFGDQRHELRSRPNSESSAKSRGKQPVYQQQSADYKGLDEEQVPPPVPSKKAGDDLESAYPGPITASNRDGKRRSSGRPDEYNLTAEQVPPPLPRGEEIHELQDTSRREEQTSEESAVPPPFAPRKPEDYIHKSRKKSDASQPQTSPALMNLYTISHLILFSILGTLARLGVQWLTFYPGTPIVTPVIWANFGGSLIMGFLTEDRRLFSAEWETTTSTPASSKRTSKRFSSNSASNAALSRVPTAQRTKIKKTIPLYVGLATGFCGSFTSFSSFARDMFLALSNNLPTPINHPYPTGSTSPTISSTVSRNGGYSLLALLATIISTLALSLGGLLTGAHLALLFEPITPRIPMRLGRRILDPLMVVLGFGSWLGAIFLAIFPPDRFSSGPESWRGTVLFALVFAPVGCLGRFYASLLLNPLVPCFPLGTFGANMFGCAVEAMCYSIQHVGVDSSARIGGGRVGCQVLQGVQDGFCGCLTTVSTWVSEMNALRRKHAYVYAVASVLGGLALMVVIMGSVRWSVGWSSPVCDTGYPNKYVA